MFFPSKLARFLATATAVAVLGSSFLTVAQASSAGNLAGSTFQDVSISDPDGVFIEYLAQRGIVAGFGDNTFRPAGELTRAQAAALMVRALGLPVEVGTQSGFGDVPSEHWAAPVVAVAAKAGLIRGFPDGTFRPDEPITRAQAATMTLRLAGQSTDDLNLPLPQDVTPDHWAAGAVGVACAAGLMDVSEGNFSPDMNISRGAMAKALALTVTLSPETRNLPLAGELVPQSGTIKLRKAGETDFRLVDARTQVGPGDSIETGSGSLAQVLFPDGSGLLLEANLEMALRETRGLAYITGDGSPGTAVDWLKVDLQHGKMTVFLASTMALEEPAGAAAPATLPWWRQPRQKRVRVQVEMPSGQAAITGTVGTFEIAGDGSSKVYNLTGGIAVTSGQGQFTLPPGQSVSLLRGGQALQPREMSGQELAGFVKDIVRNFLEVQARHAVENQAAPSPGEQNGMPAAVQQQENIQAALDQAQQTIRDESAVTRDPGGSPPPVVVSPVVATPPAGTVLAGTEVTLSTATVGAAIHYTLDGAAPTAASPLYTEPLRIDASTTIKAIGVKAGAVSSPVATFAYTVEASPVPNSTITPTTAVFDKNGGTDIDVTLDLQGNTLTAIKNASTALTPDADYTVSGSAVTIKANYLAAQALGSLVLTFEFSAGANVNLTVTVQDSTPSSDATLSGLALSAGTLTPAFSPETTSYSVSVTSAVYEITVTPTANHAAATIAVNEAAVTSGQPSGALALAEGANTVLVVVTAGDSITSRTYTVTVTRAAPAATFTAVGAGGGFSSMGFAVAMKSDGTVWTWGPNTNGELGDGTTTTRTAPVQVIAPVGETGFLTNVTAISSGVYGTLALRTDGTVAAWGPNNGGPLGDGTAVRKKTPIVVQDPGDPSGYLTGVKAVSAGSRFSLALKTDGTVWAWGTNDYGQLGQGTDTADHYLPVQVKGPGGTGYLTDVVEIAAGYDYALAVKADGTVWAWGCNGNAQLGDGTWIHQSAPIQVHGPGNVGFLTDIAAVDAGFSHSVALAKDGTVWAWGTNEGRLGDGTASHSPTPVHVVGPGGTGLLTGVTAVQAGEDHTAALTSDGSVWSWGLSPEGQLGTNEMGPTVQALSPVQVVGPGGAGVLADIAAIGVGNWGSFTLALRSDGTVWNWGNIPLNLNNKPSPVQVLFP